MVSLMPSIPTINPPSSTFTRVRGRKYDVQELLQVPVEKLSKDEIRKELKYLQDTMDYRGSRDVKNLQVGRALLTEARRVSALPPDQRAQAAPTIIAGLNTANQRLPEGYTVVRRVGEVPGVPDLASDNPQDTRAANRPSLVTPWTDWDGSVRRGNQLPSNTTEDAALVRLLKKRIGDWLEKDRPQRQREGEQGAISSSNHCVLFS